MTRVKEIPAKVYKCRKCSELTKITQRPNAIIQCVYCGSSEIDEVQDGFKSAKLEIAAQEAKESGREFRAAFKRVTGVETK